MDKLTGINQIKAITSEIRSLPPKEKLLNDNQEFTIATATVFLVRNKFLYQDKLMGIDKGDNKTSKIRS